MQPGPTEIQKIGEPAAMPTLVAQLMTGHRDPNVTNKEAYSYDDFKKLSVAIYSKIPPVSEENGFFVQLLAAYKNTNEKDRAAFLHNAQIFIAQLIENDLHHEFSKATLDGLNVFIVSLPSEFQNLFLPLQQNLEKIEEEKKTPVEDLNPPKDGEIDINQYIHETLSKEAPFINIKEPLAKKKYKTRANAEMFAHDLKQIQLSALRDLNISDFHNKRFEQYKSESLSVGKIYDNFNEITNMIGTDILMAKDLKHQQRIYKFYCYVANECIKIGDYQSALAIVAGLTQGPVSRLDQFILSTQSKKVQEILEEVKRVTDPSGSYKELRSHMESAKSKGELVVVPISVLQGDFTFMEQGNPNMQTIGENKKINEDKLMMIGNSLSDNVLDYQLKTKDEPYRTNLPSKLSADKLRNNELYQKSREIYQKPKEGEKNKKPVYNHLSIAETKRNFTEKSQVESAADQFRDILEGSTKVQNELEVQPEQKKEEQNKLDEARKNKIMLEIEEQSKKAPTLNNAAEKAYDASVTAENKDKSYTDFLKEEIQKNLDKINMDEYKGKSEGEIAGILFMQILEGLFAPLAAKVKQLEEELKTKEEQPEKPEEGKNKTQTELEKAREAEAKLKQELNKANEQEVQVQVPDRQTDQVIQPQKEQEEQPNKKKLSVAEHMKNYHAPEMVQQLAQKGTQQYQEGKITATEWAVRDDVQQTDWDLPDSGAGREKPYTIVSMSSFKDAPRKETLYLSIEGDYIVLGPDNQVYKGKIEGIDLTDLTNPWVKNKIFEFTAEKGHTPKSWVEQTFTKNETALLEELEKIPPPQSYSCQEIEETLTAATKEKLAVDEKLPLFTIVQGIGVNDLHRTPLGQNCLLQVASQFDFQEAPNAQDYPVSTYLTDKTQGPQASIEAAAAALHRKAAKRSDQLPHGLSQLLPEKYTKYYKDGYLDLRRIKKKDKIELRDHILANIEKIHVLPQWVTCESSGASQMQVFCAAPSFQEGGARTEIDDEICEALVVAQYKATAQLAVIRSRETGEVVPLHLTLVGQGAFKNNHSVMKKAMEVVAEVVKNEKVAVYVHAYNKDAQNILTTQMADSNDKLAIRTMNAETFRIQPHPQITIETVAKQKENKIEAQEEAAKKQAQTTQVPAQPKETIVPQEKNIVKPQEQPQTLISRLQKIQALLEQSTEEGPDNQYRQWAQTWRYEDRLDLFSRIIIHMSKKIGNTNSPKAAGKTALFDLTVAVRNLENNPQMLENLLKKYPELKAHFEKYIQLLEIANDEYSRYSQSLASQVSVQAQQKTSPKKQDLFAVTISDITKVVVEEDKKPLWATVNAANQNLILKGGVSGAIHTKGGDEIIGSQCLAYPDKNGIRCPTGEVRITTAGNLPNAGFVFHTAAPDQKITKNANPPTDQNNMMECYLRSMKLADQMKLEGIRFPMLGANIFEWDKEEAATLAAHAARIYKEQNPDSNLKIEFCLLNDNEMAEILRSVNDGEDKYKIPPEVEVYAKKIANLSDVSENNTMKKMMDEIAKNDVVKSANNGKELFETQVRAQEQNKVGLEAFSDLLEQNTDSLGAEIAVVPTTVTVSTTPLRTEPASDPVSNRNEPLTFNRATATANTEPVKDKLETKYFGEYLNKFVIENKTDSPYKRLAEIMIIQNSKAETSGLSQSKNFKNHLDNHILPVLELAVSGAKWEANTNPDMKSKQHTFEQTRDMFVSIRALVKNRSRYTEQQFEKKCEAILNNIPEQEDKDAMRKALNEVMKGQFYEGRKIHHLKGNALHRATGSTKFDTTEKSSDPDLAKMRKRVNIQHEQGGRVVKAQFDYSQSKLLDGGKLGTHFSTFERELKSFQKQMSDFVTVAINEYGKGTEDNRIKIELNGQLQKYEQALGVLMEFKKRAILENKEFFAIDHEGNQVTITPKTTLESKEENYFNYYANQKPEIKSTFGNKTLKSTAGEQLLKSEFNVGKNIDMTAAMVKHFEKIKTEHQAKMDQVLDKATQELKTTAPDKRKSL